jgi:DNA repair protein RecO (recombination protein O)
LKILIDYYTFHLDGFRKPKSLDVLKEIFSWKIQLVIQ